MPIVWAKCGCQLRDSQGREMRLGRFDMQEYALLKQGKLQVQEDILDGIERVPEAFFRMLRGENQGKQLVRLVASSIDK